MRSYLWQPVIASPVIQQKMEEPQTAVSPSVRHTGEPQSERNSCLWLFHLLLDDWGGDHWLPQIGPHFPLAMVSVLLTWSGWRKIQ